MTEEQNRIAYIAAKSYWDATKSRSDAIEELYVSGVRASYAAIIIDVYVALRKGALIKRAISQATMDYFLTSIGKDNGAEFLAKALFSFARNISYRTAQGDSLPGDRSLYAKHLAACQEPVSKLAEASSDSEFIEEVQQASNDGPEKRRRRLEAAVKKPRLVPRLIFVFERNADVVAEALLNANGVCQICFKPAPFKRVSNNSPYLEVHHRTPLTEGGDDSVENAIAICPNCHRDEHFGPRALERKRAS